MADLVRLTIDNDIAVITIDNPPVNALSPGVPEGIVKAIGEISGDVRIRAAVLIGGGRTFIAGADIKEFGKITSGQKREVGLAVFLDAIENSSKPVVAAIHGTALGGGLETAMAAHYRVANASARFGQPEVKLGLIPGAGGTQRLPRLVGIAKALEMCAGGEPIGAADALACGLINRIVEGDLLQGAVAFAREIAAAPPVRTRDRSEKLAADAAVFAAAREAALKKQRNLLAPQKAIDAVEAAAKLPFDEGMEVERRLFEECLFSSQSKALIHVFFGEREVAKIPGLPPETRIVKIERVGVIGAGTMGGGIAMVFANAGIPVLLREADQTALDRGLATIRKNYENSVKKGRFSEDVMDQRLSLIQPALDWSGFEEVDLVIEAVFENMELKKRIFGELDGIAKPEAILATNTSSLSIDEIASATSRPQSVIGTHFFSPANVMRLLEVVRGQATSNEAIATIMQLARKIAKIAVLVGNCRGFAGNRMFHCYRREAQFLAEEGALPEQIDKALVDFGMAMGPLATGDLAGLDVGWRIRKEYRHLERPGVRKPIAEDRLCELGRFGQKTGAGWHRYDENRRAIPDPEVVQVLRGLAAGAGIAQRQISDEEIVERCIYALVNEGARILEEGFALRAVDIDVIYLNGYGFPAWRGGPMWYADSVGLNNVLERVRHYHTVHGELWTPAPLLERLAMRGGSFSEYQRERQAVE